MAAVQQPGDRRVVVGVDRSSSREALRWAGRQAALTGSVVDAVIPWYDADLLVVGSRGRGGFPGMPLGPVSRHFIRHSPRPVVIIRG